MKKIKTLTVFFAFILCVFTSCETTKGGEMLPFNAIIGVGGPLEFKEDFIKSNRTYGALYWNEIGELVEDITSPKFRTFIVTEKAQLEDIFSVYPDIDLEKNMIVMYVFTAIYVRALKITNITLFNEKLKIDFKYQKGKPDHNDATSPQTRFLVLRMNKLDIDTLEFNLLNPRG